MTKPWVWVTEQVWGWGTGLRSAWRVLSGTFYPTQPAYDKTVLNYDMCRQLYRNDGADSHLGAGFCKPIIDNAVAFIDLPVVDSADETVDNLLNRNIARHWKPKILEMFRNAMREGKTVVRLWTPLLTDPLATDEEREACKLIIYEPERVQIIYDPQNPDSIRQALVISRVEFPDEVQPNADPSRGARPQVKEHEIWEVITKDRFRFYDKTDHKWIDSWARDNPYGFVPFIEVYNEYDSSLSGGQSDLESVYPFVKAFHEVLLQVLKAHKYHSIPKLKFQVSDITGFLQNNFPETIDENGAIVPNSSIKWQGREVLMLGPDDDLGFIEMTSILADSKTLMEFLIDCISIASQTPEWAFMRVEGGTSQGAMNAQTIPYEKKIEKKRIMFQEPLQMICKMCLAIGGQTPIRPEIVWPEIRVDSLVTMSQATQQFTMSLEVLLERKLISENTAREGLRVFRLFRTMKDPVQEAKDAQDNLQLGQLPPPLDPNIPAAAKAASNGSGSKDRVPAVTGKAGK